jgi:hypothetical protein
MQSKQSMAWIQELGSSGIRNRQPYDGHLVEERQKRQKPYVSFFQLGDKARLRS